MYTFKVSPVLGIAGVCVMGLMSPAANANLVTNGNFSTGVLSPWGGSGASIVTSPVPSGDTYAAQIANASSNGIEQLLTTNGSTPIDFQVGTYTYSGVVAADSAEVAAGGFAALAIGTASQLSSSSPAADTIFFFTASDTYKPESLTLTVASGSALIGQQIAVAFGSASSSSTPAGNFYFDNADLTVPEPGSLGLIGLAIVGMAGLGLIKRRRRTLV